MMVVCWLLCTFIAVLALFGTHVRAQTIALSGGVSTFSEAKGGTVAFQGKDTEAVVGAGILGGHFALGATGIRRFGRGDVVAGQQEMRLDLPTDLFNTGHTSFGTGLGAHALLSENSVLNVFVGASSQEGGSVLFQSTTLEQFTTYARWTKRLSAHCGVDSFAYWSSSPTLLGSTSCSVPGGVKWAGKLRLWRRCSLWSCKPHRATASVGAQGDVRAFKWHLSTRWNCFYLHTRTGTREHCRSLQIDPAS